MITVVTGFIAFPGHEHPREDHARFGRQLLDCDLPIVFCEGELRNCWLAKYLEAYNGECTYSIADNPNKNTLAYHIALSEKTSRLAEVAANRSDADVLVWMDFGIFHIPGVTKEIVQDFALRARSERAITIPGCWEKQADHDDAYPNWRFCGGLLVAAREHVAPLDHVMKQEYIRRLRATNHVTWEVNVLAAVEQRHPELPIWWYKADHNASMFLNYPATEDVN